MYDFLRFKPFTCRHFPVFPLAAMLPLALCCPRCCLSFSVLPPPLPPPLQLPQVVEPPPPLLAPTLPKASSGCPVIAVQGETSQQAEDSDNVQKEEDVDVLLNAGHPTVQVLRTRSGTLVARQKNKAAPAAASAAKRGGIGKACKGRGSKVTSASRAQQLKPKPKTKPSRKASESLKPAMATTPPPAPAVPARVALGPQPPADPPPAALLAQPTQPKIVLARRSWTSLVRMIPPPPPVPAPSFPSHSQWSTSEEWSGWSW
jgi:hypothetical protein